MLLKTASMHAIDIKSHAARRGCFSAVRLLFFSLLCVSSSLSLRAEAEDLAVDGGVIEAVSDQAPDAAPAPVEAPAVRQRNWFQRFFFKPDWAQALSECHTPRDICRMVEKHISYKEESVDQWATAKETWERGYGDCEDFAVCIQAMCRELGFHVSVRLYYTLSPSLMGHAVVVGENEDGSQWFSSNGSFENVDSSREMADRVADILWCDAGRMWSVMLADVEVDRLVRSGVSLNTVGAPPVAVSAQ